MNLKQRFSFVFSCIFSLVVATVMCTIYFLFSSFRTTEFAARLGEKGENTAKILLTVKEIDFNTQKILDKNSISRLYTENTEIFDEKDSLIYDTNHLIEIKWQPSDFEQVREKQKFFERKGRYDVVGLAYHDGNKFYYVFISAEDTYGNRRLRYLSYLLLGAFVVSTAAVWLLSFTLSKRSLEPLDKFRLQIQEINDHSLTVRLQNDNKPDEINALAHSFNQLMDRIDQAYNRQREFTGNASHELRTPVARIAAQLENMIQSDTIEEDLRNQLKSVSDDVFQVSEIISSLVALADISRRENASSFDKLRLDELVFAATSALSVTYPDFHFKFDIDNNSGRDTDLEVLADETLLKIVLQNLFKNAYLYSDNRMVDCLIIQQPETIELIVTNTGDTPQVTDTAQLFQTFYRGSNTRHVNGSGIGLSIVRRVLEFHKATIQFNIIGNRTNQVVVTFPKSES